MARTWCTTTAATVTAALLSCATTAGAQSLGTFRWQLQPYCNIVTLAVTQAGGLYHLDGTDDQCGAGRDLAAVRGLAFFNPDGTIGFGLSIVTAPGGAAVHVDAEITLATLSGTWRDSAASSGTFQLTPGAGSGGSARPVPSVIPTTIRLLTDGGVLARGQLGAGAIPASGPGVRMMWYPGAAAFRAGRVDGLEWDAGNIGEYSAGFGYDTTAVGLFSVAAGWATVASGLGSTALGFSTVASGELSVAMGGQTTASGLRSLAAGSLTSAEGAASFAAGSRTTAAGDVSMAFGYGSRAGGRRSVALGSFALTTPDASGSFVFADDSSIAPFGALGPNGFNVRASGGFQFYTNPAATVGAVLAPGASDWATLSDVNSKENFRDLDGEDLLARLAQVNIREWNYKSQDASIRHIGPTAQDFRAAFGLGDFPLRINTIDAAGVALGGVRALDGRTRLMPQPADLARLEAELSRLTAENADLQARLDRLESLLEKR